MRLHSDGQTQEARVDDTSRIRVAVVDGTAFGRAALPRLIEADPLLEVVAIVRSADEAVLAVEAHEPDVLVAGMHHDPEDILALLRWNMGALPRPVLVLLPADPEPELVVQVLEAGAAYSMPWDLSHSPARLIAFQTMMAARLKALGAGHPDVPPAARNLPLYPLSPQGSASSASDNEDTQELLEEAVEPLDAQGRGAPRASRQAAGASRKGRMAVISGDKKAEVVVLGGGSGSPALARHILSHLPSDVQLGFLLVLRLPPALVQLYADRLAAECALPVSVAQENDPVRPGQILISPPGKNLGLVRTGRFPKALVRLLPPESGIAATPSMDVTLRAAATIYGPTAVGLYLSGLSRDGLQGFQTLRARGGHTHILDYKHALVGNTNRLLYEASAVDEVIDPVGAVTLLTRLGLRSPV